MADNAHLQGASLDQAQLQGASLSYKAQLQGASLDLVQYWRTSLTRAAVDLVDEGKGPTPMSSPDISKLIDGVNKNVPKGLALSSALLRLSILQKDMPANEEQALAAPWRQLEDRQREWNTDTDNDLKLARFLADLGCGKDIHVVRGLLLRLGHDWNNRRPYAPTLARALGDPCARGRTI